VPIPKEIPHFLLQNIDTNRMIIRTSLKVQALFYTFLNHKESSDDMKKNQSSNYFKKPKKSQKSRRHSMNSGSYIPNSFINNEPILDSINRSQQSPIKFQKKQSSISDEEEQLLLTPLKNDLLDETPHLRDHSYEKKEKASAYFLMFCNICRSFIAIGVLAIPYGFTKSGKKAFFVC
jgi:hypothetical protein